MGPTFVCVYAEGSMKLIEKGSGGFFPEACGKTLPTPFPLRNLQE